MKVANPDGKAKKGSQKWIQKLINDNVGTINSLSKQNLNLPQDEEIDWLSPLETDDSEMNGPKTSNEWKGALRLLHRCLGLKEHIFSKFVVELSIDVKYLK